MKSFDYIGALFKNKSIQYKFVVSSPRKLGPYLLVKSDLEHNYSRKRYDNQCIATTILYNWRDGEYDDRWIFY